MTDGSDNVYTGDIYKANGGSAQYQKLEGTYYKAEKQNTYVNKGNMTHRTDLYQSDGDKIDIVGYKPYPKDNVYHAKKVNGQNEVITIPAYKHPDTDLYTVDDPIDIDMYKDYSTPVYKAGKEITVPDVAVTAYERLPQTVTTNQYVNVPYNLYGAKESETILGYSLSTRNVHEVGGAITKKTGKMYKAGTPITIPSYVESPTPLYYASTDVEVPKYTKYTGNLYATGARVANYPLYEAPVYADGGMYEFDVFGECSRFYEDDGVKTYYKGDGDAVTDRGDEVTVYLQGEKKSNSYKFYYEAKVTNSNGTTSTTYLPWTGGSLYSYGGTATYYKGNGKIGYLRGIGVPVYTRKKEYSKEAFEYLRTDSIPKLGRKLNEEVGGFYTKVWDDDNPKYLRGGKVNDVVDFYTENGTTSIPSRGTTPVYPLVEYAEGSMQVTPIDESSEITTWYEDGTTSPGYRYNLVGAAATGLYEPDSSKDRTITEIDTSKQYLKTNTFVIDENSAGETHYLCKDTPISDLYKVNATNPTKVTAIGTQVKNLKEYDPDESKDYEGVRLAKAKISRSNLYEVDNTVAARTVTPIGDKPAVDLYQRDSTQDKTVYPRKQLAEQDVYEVAEESYFKQLRVAIENTAKVELYEKDPNYEESSDIKLTFHPAVIETQEESVLMKTKSLDTGKSAQTVTDDEEVS